MAASMVHVLTFRALHQLVVIACFDLTTLQAVLVQRTGMGRIYQFFLGR